MESGARIGADFVADTAGLVRAQPERRAGGVGDVPQPPVRFDGGEAVHRGGEHTVAEGHRRGDLADRASPPHHLRGCGVDGGQPGLVLVARGEVAGEDDLVARTATRVVVGEVDRERQFAHRTAGEVDNGGEPAGPELLLVVHRFARCVDDGGEPARRGHVLLPDPLAGLGTGLGERRRGAPGVAVFRVGDEDVKPGGVAGGGHGAVGGSRRAGTELAVRFSGGTDCAAGEPAPGGGGCAAGAAAWAWPVASAETRVAAWSGTAISVTGTQVWRPCACGEPSWSA